MGDFFGHEDALLGTKMGENLWGRMGINHKNHRMLKKEM
jgi:hypothetical protein